jgi:hypothetical protein
MYRFRSFARFGFILILGSGCGPKVVQGVSKQPTSSDDREIVLARREIDDLYVAMQLAVLIDRMVEAERKRQEEEERLAHEAAERAEEARRPRTGPSGLAYVMLDCGVDVLGESVCQELLEDTIGSNAAAATCTGLMTAIRDGEPDALAMGISFAKNALKTAEQNWLKYIGYGVDVIEFGQCVYDRY